MGFYRTVITKAGCSFLFCSNYFMTNYSIVFFCILNSLVSYTTIIPTNPNLSNHLAFLYPIFLTFSQEASLALRSVNPNLSNHSAFLFLIFLIFSQEASLALRSLINNWFIISKSSFSVNFHAFRYFQAAIGKLFP